MDPLCYSKTLLSTELRMLQENLNAMNSSLFQLQDSEFASQEEIDFKRENVILLQRQITDLELGLRFINNGGSNQ